MTGDLQISPSLIERRSGGLAVLVDPEMDRLGILVAFTERSGGVSLPPYAELNLAAHVGDDAGAVDDNRQALMSALGLESVRASLTTAEQVHGTSVTVIDAESAGAGAFAVSGLGPVPATDALVTTEPGLPLMLLYADCVPIVLVAPPPHPGVAVVHAGWKGALGRIPGKAASLLAEEAGCEASELLAYIGPHIGPCHYQVDTERLSQFTEAFGSMAAAQGRLDLGYVVSESLGEVGVPTRNMVRAGICTAERTDSFFSYRAEGSTGRHGALAVILGKDR